MQANDGVREALLLARSWITHAAECGALNPTATDDGFSADCTCSYREKVAGIDRALLQPNPIPGMFADRAGMWATDKDQIGELAIALAAHAASIEEEQGEWTWRDVAAAAIRATLNQGEGA